VWPFITWKFSSTKNGLLDIRVVTSMVGSLTKFLEFFKNANQRSTLNSIIFENQQSMVRISFLIFEDHMLSIHIHYHHLIILDSKKRKPSNIGIHSSMCIIKWRFSLTSVQWWSKNVHSMWLVNMHVNNVCNLCHNYFLG